MVRLSDVVSAAREPMTTLEYVDIADAATRDKLNTAYEKVEPALKERGTAPALDIVQFIKAGVFLKDKVRTRPYEEVTAEALQLLSGAVVDHKETNARLVLLPQPSKIVLTPDDMFLPEDHDQPGFGGEQGV